ncbi:hypothetical protein KSF73_05650 [Burkholderiaceae bacterium DAT-1]|nr:hypothetical protein [Burkholderiaceae bacterium DAT-1]
MTTEMHLPDPRVFSAETTAIHQLAIDLLTDNAPGAMVRHEAALDAALSDSLKAGAQTVGEVLAAAPSLAVSRCLQERIARVCSTTAGAHAVIFAIPLVMVVGVRQGHVIPGQLPDIDAIKHSLTEQGIFAKDADIWLSAKLVDQAQLESITPAQLLNWRDALQYASGGLPHDFAGAPVKFDVDGVALRYLVGVALQPAEQTPVVQLNAPMGAWAMAISKLIGEQLAHPALTLFPLPRAPQAWISALFDGIDAQKRIRFEVFASSILRKLRTDGETPVAVLSAHEGNEIRVTIGAEKNGEQWEGFVWPLQPTDRIDTIQHALLDVLQECRIEQVRVLADVLPSVKQSLPYFPLPVELDQTSETRH